MEIRISGCPLLFPAVRMLQRAFPGPEIEQVATERYCEDTLSG